MGKICMERLLNIKILPITQTMFISVSSFSCNKYLTKTTNLPCLRWKDKLWHNGQIYLFLSQLRLKMARDINSHTKLWRVRHCLATVQLNSMPRIKDRQGLQTSMQMTTSIPYYQMKINRRTLEVSSSQTISIWETLITLQILYI